MLLECLDSRSKDVAEVPLSALVPRDIANISYVYCEWLMNTGASEVHHLRRWTLEVLPLQRRNGFFCRRAIAPHASATAMACIH
jgi:hypothetical protein